MGPRKANILCLVYHREFFWPFSNNSRLFQDFRRLHKTDGDIRRRPKTDEDFRRLLKMSTDYRGCEKTTGDFQEEIRKFSTSFLSLSYSHGKEIFFAGYRFDFFSGREILVTHPN